MLYVEVISNDPNDLLREYLLLRMYNLWFLSIPFLWLKHEWQVKYANYIFMLWKLHRFYTYLIERTHLIFFSQGGMQWNHSAGQTNKCSTGLEVRETFQHLNTKKTEQGWWSRMLSKAPPCSLEAVHPIRTHWLVLPLKFTAVSGELLKSQNSGGII